MSDIASGESWVINLKRRPDRRERFLERYHRHGPALPLHIVPAVDGLDPRTAAEHPLAACVSPANDYGANPNVHATILSHLEVWDRIARSPHDYGLVFEDDVLFREDGLFRQPWPAMMASWPCAMRETPTILYCGTGSRLPADALAHVETMVSPCFGTPRLGSRYVFPWLGAFAYLLPRHTARALLDEAARQPIARALDVWLKDRFESHRYVTIPLLAYHSEYDLRQYDSDIFGIRAPQAVPTPTPARAHDRGQPAITFVLPVVTQPDRWRATIASLAARASGALRLSVIVAADADAATLEIDGVDVAVLAGAARDRLHRHDTYNQLARAALQRGATLVALWTEDAPICTDAWDARLLRYYDMLLAGDGAGIACFQTKAREAFEFAHPILTRGFLESVGHVAQSPAVFQYVKLVSYLSRTHVFMRDIEVDATEPVEPDDRAAQADFEQRPDTKRELDRAIARVTGSPRYRACGAWMPIPSEWAGRTTVGNTGDALPQFRRGT
jgi:hypothetical protein